MYTNAQYIAFTGVTISIRCDINGVTSFVPLDSTNIDYINIMALVDANEITIAPADEVQS
jgi:hypothetical protein